MTASASSSAASATPGRVWTSLDLINWTKAFFERKGLESPRLEAELLLADVLGCARIKLYTDFERPVPEAQLAKFRECVRRRAEAREPLQYILGHTEFLDLKLKVTPAVLIPRPETEELAEWAIGALKLLPGDEALALDIGTGSGCLAVAIASKVPRAKVLAVDVSAAALDVARENAANAGVGERVSFVAGDVFAGLPDGSRGAFDLLVANPPYIDPALKETLAPEVREHEPAGALFAGDKGLAVLKTIVAGASAWLKPGGKLGLELSPEQAGTMKALLEAAGFAAVEIRKDARGLERFALAARP